MNKKIYISLIALTFMLTAFVPANKPPHKKGGGQITWLTVEEAIEKSKTNPKKFFIDVYTDWCGWCKKMDKTTFEDAKVAAYMNENFYCIKFDAETNEKISLGDKTYIKKGRNHQLAEELLKGKMSFPSVVYLDETFSLIQPVPGYRNAREFMNITKFFGDNHYKNKTWDQYNGIEVKEKN